jgi:hypothetical protein
MSEKNPAEELAPLHPVTAAPGINEALVHHAGTSETTNLVAQAPGGRQTDGSNTNEGVCQRGR